MSLRTEARTAATTAGLESARVAKDGAGEAAATARPPLSRPGRALYLTAGCLFVGLAWLGAILPVLPTTPFLLLALWAFSRSSPRLHAWLLRARIFGPFLRDWNRYRGVRQNVKMVATVMLTAVVGLSLLGGLRPHWVVVLLLLAVIGTTVILRLPTIPSDAPRA